MFVFRGNDWTLEKYNPLQINIVEGHWGDEVKIQDVRVLLETVAQNILQFFDRPFEACIYVECRPNRATPIVNCLCSATGEYIVTLTGSDCPGWAYGFAHEFCHVLTGHERLYCRPNEWFVESLCELASIFVMRLMARGQPISNWKDFLYKFSWTAEWLISRPECQLPADTTLPVWFKANESHLRSDPYLRDKNALIALRLLPLIESNPQYWQSVCFIPDSLESFESFLCEWRKNCPDKLQPFVAQIGAVFDFDL